MSSNIIQAIKDYRKNLHNVGNLNRWNKKVVNQGAIAEADMDNFTLVTLDFNANGERVCEKIPNIITKGYLVATPEDYMKEYETISSFFNEAGERVRVIKMTVGMRFECSNFDFEDGDLQAHPLKNGQKVYYDSISEKFIISNATPNGAAGYLIAANKLVVVDKDCVSIDGQPVIRFEVTQ